LKKLLLDSELLELRLKKGFELNGLYVLAEAMTEFVLLLLLVVDAVG